MAVVVRAGAAPMMWLGGLAAAVGLVPEGFTGRRIGLYGGAAVFLVAAAVVAAARTGRYRELERGATRAARGDILQDRAVTLRNRRRRHRWWLLAAFAAAVGSAFAVPAAGGLLLAGAGAGLWLKARALGRREEAAERLLWVRTDWVEGGRPAGARVKGYRTTGPAAGDAAPGGARRR
ncbi:hypothetical protein DDQ41_09000 [Streptomyces spongiicola]|uniref:Integral membrane protein n=1 Tax=Streptomyces spongiicola TaxID=1690221 RepID=A0ABN5KR63_9ACTN|nr:hypothetical protein [Streptomyces spongiicola]AWK09038.1 hypothetical protein DDQ41_09000 [Streptomyces spongiicola]